MIIHKAVGRQYDWRPACGVKSNSLERRNRGVKATCPKCVPVLSRDLGRSAELASANSDAQLAAYLAR